jgi:hypothetical protein
VTIGAVERRNHQAEPAAPPITTTAITAIRIFLFRDNLNASE